MAAVGNENACGVVPAAGPTPALSRSSSRKAEQSPYRRNPMAEIDENTLRNSNTGEPQKKFSGSTVSAAHQKATERGKESTGTAACHSVKAKPDIPDDAPVAASDTGALSAKMNVTASLVAERPAAGCRSRRASRDFDQSSNTTRTPATSSWTSRTTTSSTRPRPRRRPSHSRPASPRRAPSSRPWPTSTPLPPRRTTTTPTTTPLAAAPPTTRAPSPPHRPARTTTAPRCAGCVTPARWSRLSRREQQVSAVLGARVGGVQDRTWSAGDEVVGQAGSNHGAPSPMNRRPRQSKQRPAQPEPTGRSRAGSGNGNSTLHRGRSSAHRSSGSSGAREAS